MKSYSVEETAKILQCHPNSVYIILREGKLKGYRPGKSWVIFEPDILSYITGDASCSKEEKSGTPTLM